jgi:hypothetical protein
MLNCDLLLPALALRLLFDLEYDGDDTFLWIVGGLLPNYTAVQPSRSYCSLKFPKRRVRTDVEARHVRFQRCSPRKSTGLEPHIGRAHCQFWVELMLWPTVSRPIRLGLGPSFGAHDRIFLFFFLLRDNCFALRLETPSLTRGRVCNL